MNQITNSLSNSGHLRELNTELGNSIGPATEQAYYLDWSLFVRWCAENGHTELPAHPQVVSLFLGSERNTACGLATLARRIAAIGYFHRQNQFPSPIFHEDADLIHQVMAKKSARSKSTTPPRLTNRIWGEIIHAIPDTRIDDVRDRAILALHVAGAFRAIELARLSYAQLRIEHQIIQINLGRFRSNTSRGSSSIMVADGHMFFPMSHLRRWIEMAKISEGAVFRHCQGGQSSREPLDEKDIQTIIAERTASAGYQKTTSRSPTFSSSQKGRSL